MYDFTNSKEMLIGLWEGPRKHAMMTQEAADARYVEIREAGINMVFVYAELKDDEWLKRTIKTAERNDIRLIIDLGAVYTDMNALYDAIDRTRYSSAVIGYNIVDEPGFKLFDELGNLRDKIKEYVGDKYLVMCNLNPNYAPDLMFSENPIEGMTKYQTYLDVFMQKVRPDLLHFDYYPYTSDKSMDDMIVGKMILNLTDIRDMGLKLCTTKVGRF